MIKFLVAADFSPISFGGWHLLNAHLQKVTDLPIHMVVAESRSEQKDGLFHQKNPLVYADPMDAVQLVQEQGYLPVARLRGESDEVLLVGAAEGAYQGAADVKAACKILAADSVHLRQAGLRLLPDLSQADVEWVNVETFQETFRNGAPPDQSGSRCSRVTEQHFCAAFARNAQPFENIGTKPDGRFAPRGVAASGLCGKAAQSAVQ